MKLKYALLRLMTVAAIVLCCSCSNVNISTDDFYYSAAASLAEELESQGINVSNTDVDLKLSGGPGYATIIICVDDCTDEEAERIFDEVIFPFMSRDNSVIEDLMMPGCIVSQYYIAVSGGDGSCSYYSEYSSQRCEIWENEDNVICLEDYR